MVIKLTKIAAELEYSDIYECIHMKVSMYNRYFYSYCK